jgi:hypothetical protein
MIIMQIPKSAGQSILKLASTRKIDWEESIDDPSAPFKYGDPTGVFNPDTRTVDGGVFFTIYNPEVCKEKFKHSTRGESSGEEKGFPGYEAAVSTVYAGPDGNMSPGLDTDVVQRILSDHLFFWKDFEGDTPDSYLLHEPSIEERCVMLAKAFHPVPKLLEFAWLSHPEYSDFHEVRGILRNRTAVSVAKPAYDDLEVDEEFEDEEELPQPVRPAKRVESAAKAKPAPPTKAAPVKKSAAALIDEFEEEDEVDAEEVDDDFEEEVKPKAKAKPAKATPTKPVKSKPVVEEDELDDELDDELAEDELDDELDEDDFEETEVDDEDDEDEETKSDDFDDEVEDQLNSSLSKAKAIARSSKRVVAPEPEKRPVKRRPR